MVALYLFLLLAIVLEAFPISSSGHVAVLMSCYAWLTGHAFDQILYTVFDHLSHVAIAGAVIIFFFKRSLVYLQGIVKKWSLTSAIIKKIFLLGCITDTITVLMYGLTRYYDVAFLPLPLGFFITACLLYSLRFIPKTNKRSWDLRSAVILGCVQSFALLPGISRLASTYVAARWYGIRAQRAFELSFLIELPISIAGGLLGLFYMHQHQLLAVLLNGPAALVMIMGVIVLVAGLSLIEKMVVRNSLWRWSEYMIVVTLITTLLWYKGIV